MGKEKNKVVCKKCGEDLGEGLNECPSCGEKIESKKYRLSPKAALIVCCVILMIVGLLRLDRNRMIKELEMQIVDLQEEFNGSLDYDEIYQEITAINADNLYPSVSQEYKDILEDIESEIEETKGEYQIYTLAMDVSEESYNYDEIKDVINQYTKNYLEKLPSDSIFYSEVNEGLLILTSKSQELEEEHQIALNNAKQALQQKQEQNEPVVVENSPSASDVYYWIQDRYEYYDYHYEGGEYSGDKYTDEVFADAASHFNISLSKVDELYSDFSY